MALRKSNTMATFQLLNVMDKFDEMIVDVIADLRRNQRRESCESIHKEIVKIGNFSNISKEDLMNRINILRIDEKNIYKRNRSLDSYYVNEDTSPDNNNFLETPHKNISFRTSADDTEPIFPVTLQTPSKPRERPTSMNPILDFAIRFPSSEGFRTFTPEENCPPTLNLTQTLTLTGGNCPDTSPDDQS